MTCPENARRPGVGADAPGPGRCSCALPGCSDVRRCVMKLTFRLPGVGLRTSSWVRFSSRRALARSTLVGDLLGHRVALLAQQRRS